VPKEEAAKTALLLKINEVDAVVGGLFLRLYIARSNGDEDAYRRAVEIYVDIAKTYARLAGL
jgi:hypothetical protein